MTIIKPDLGTEVKYKPKREIRNQPFCWQHKETLWDIRRHCKDKKVDLSKVLAVYLVLTEIASNKASENFEEYAITIQKMAGVGKKACTNALEIFQEMGVIEVSQLRRTSDGKFAKREFHLVLTEGHSATTAEAVAAQEPYLEEIPIVEKIPNSNISVNNNFLFKGNNLEEDYSNFVGKFNTLFNGSYTGYDKEGKRNYKNLLAAGKTLADFKNAFEAASQDEWAIEHGQMTPAKFTQMDKFESYLTSYKNNNGRK